MSSDPQFFDDRMIETDAGIKLGAIGLSLWVGLWA